MLVITPAVRKHMVETFAVKADASDEEVRKAIGEKIVSGELSLDTLKQVTTNEATEAKSGLDALVQAAVTKALASVQLAAPAAPAPVINATLAPAGTGAKAYGAAGGDGAAAFNAEYDSVRVKSVVEQYSDNRTAATWDKSANPFLVKGFSGCEISKHVDGMPYTLDMPTDRSKAIAGAWFKHMAIRAMRRKGMSIPAHLQMREHDQELVKYAANECRFIGEVQGGVEYDGEKLAKGLHVKAVLDDSTSGGLEAVPIEFDAAVILTPLLNGELFPLVSLTNVSRRRQEATKIGNPTMAWGTASGTATTLFDTDAFISAFDNTIYPITGALELGLDFLNDSPVAIGQIVIQRYGQAFLKAMDDVIASGNGTNQPEGLFTASGVTAVTPSSAGNAPTIGDYEGLMFGVGKEYLQEAGMPPNSRAVFVGTQTSYSRARSIPVDSSNDARRIFGMDQMDYRLFNFRYAINSSIANTKLGFFCMNRYRMYRRQGLEVRLVSEDWSLARSNKEGILVRARFGGSLETSAAGAKITNSQS